MPKITKAANGDLTEVATTLTDDLVDAVTAPLGAFKTEPTEFVSPRVAGFASIGYFLGGVVVGDRFGEAVPLLGGRRA